MEEDYFNKYSFLLDRTSRRVKQYAKTRFKEMDFGITVDQWMILKALDENQNHLLNQSELAEITFKDTPTLTRIIDLLVNKNLVERKADSEDRRKFNISLTGEGILKVEDLKPKIDLIRQKAWQNLTPGDFENFKRILNTIYDNLEGND